MAGIGMIDGKVALVTLNDGHLYGMVKGDDGEARFIPAAEIEEGTEVATDDPRVREALGLPSLN